MKSTRHFKRFGVVIVVALVAIGTLANVALADDAGPADVGGTLTTGPLKVDSIATIDLGSVPLTGRAFALTAATDSGTMLVTDARGDGAGWKIQAVRSAFSFSTGEEPNVITRTLDGTMHMPAAVVTAYDPTSSITQPTTAAQDILVGTPKTIATAATDAGMGSWNLTFGADLHKITMGITADDYAGHYTGTVTVTSAIGPS